MRESSVRGRTRSHSSFNSPIQASQTVRSTTPDATLAELDQAISSAERAFKTWRQTSVLHRQQILFRYQQLIKDHQADIAVRCALSLSWRRAPPPTRGTGPARASG